MNQGTESSVKTEINKDTRGTLNQVHDWVVIHDFMSLRATLAKSGPLNFPTEKKFLLFFAHEKGLGHMFQK